MQNNYGTDLRKTFDEEAELYDISRPHYPAELFDTIIKNANLQPGSKLVEIGPGTGALTEYLLQDKETDLHVMDVDMESIAYLKEHFSQLQGRIIFGDFLRVNPTEIVGDKPFAVVGNFPYNISVSTGFTYAEWVRV